MLDAKLQTEVRKFSTRSEAMEASKEAKSIAAKLLLDGYRESEYKSEKCGACSFDNDWFYVVFPKVGA